MCVTHHSVHGVLYMHTTRNGAGKTQLGEVFQKDKRTNALRGVTVGAKGKSERETVFPLSETY